MVNFTMHNRSKMKPGQITLIQTDEKGNPIKPQPALILREGTFENWRKQVIECGGEVSQLVEEHVKNNGYFYEVSID